MWAPCTEIWRVKRCAVETDVWAQGRKHRAPGARARGPSPVDQAADSGLHMSALNLKIQKLNRKRTIHRARMPSPLASAALGEKRFKCFIKSETDLLAH